MKSPQRKKVLRIPLQILLHPITMPEVPGSSENTPAPAPPPQKVWVPPVYQTIHHDAVYNTVKVVVCNYCGAEFGSAGEFQVHKDANGG